ncbi:MAG: type II toxin-antitoxin system VapC family toxin [Dehalococcoidia bacterium]
MAGRVLLDTSTVVAVLRGEEAMGERLRQADEVFTSVVVLGELLFGARHSTRPTRNRERVEAFSASVTALPCDRLTAEVYSRLKQGLREKGRPIPDNDLWIAATAVQHGLVLGSRDDHFAEIEELRQETW